MLVTLITSISAVDWIVSILMFILALAVLIALHEAGHLSMAKLFNVYCKEYSIGFGPKLLQKRRKGGETMFSLRAIPLGGYVSMYGEEVELDEGVSIPQERSLDGIKKWKRAIILVAGIVTNLLLGYVFVFVSDVCFPTIYLTANVTVSENSQLAELGVKDYDRVYFLGTGFTVASSANSNINGYTGYVVSDQITYDDNNFVLVYVPTGNKSEPVFTENVYLFKGTTTPDPTVFGTWAEHGYSLNYYPDLSVEYLHLSEGVSYEAPVSFYIADGFDEEGNVIYKTEIDSEGNEHYVLNSTTIQMRAISDDGTNYYYENIGLSFKNKQVWRPFSERLEDSFKDYGNASLAIIRGIGQLFTGQGEVSGIIGIMTQSAQIYSSYTFATYFYFWAVISINLGIFNLLPFPGLDGWSLLVTVVEGITRKKIPNKVKNIVSTIGLIILFAFMIAVVVMDILRLVGVM